MEGQRGRPRVHELRPDFESRARAVFDTAAHLHADRDVHRLGDGLDDRRGAVRLVQERGARARLRDLADRAAEVDVHQVGPGRLDHSSRFGHDARLGAEDLHGEGMLVRSDAQIPECALVPVRESGAADHLGAHQSGPVAAPLAAKGLHAHTGHGSEDETRRDLDGTDRPGRVQIDAHGKGIVAGRRTFSV